MCQKELLDLIGITVPQTIDIDTEVRCFRQRLARLQSCLQEFPQVTRVRHAITFLEHGRQNAQSRRVLPRVTDSESRGASVLADHHITERVELCLNFSALCSPLQCRLVDDTPDVAAQARRNASLTK